MEIFLDCLPCVLRQVLEAARMATDQAQLQTKIMEESIQILARYRNYRCSPDMVRHMHQIVKNRTGVSDPYQRIKERDMSAAKRAYPFLKLYWRQKHQALYWSLKIAATGNIIDSAIYGEINMEHCVEQELEKAFSLCAVEDLEEQLKSAKTILFIGDNAGETVFDRVLLENLSDYTLTYAVRSEPIINDATIQDAYDSGLQEYAAVMTSGCAAPGAILEECSEEFLDVFHHADIVISKGQGNFEALSDCQRSVFFLLKAKCPMIADRLGVKLNDYVFQFHNNC